MEHTASKTITAERVPAGRLLRVGALAAVFSATANALLLAVASSLFGPVVIPPDEAVTFGQVMAASVAGAAGAAVLFAVIDRFTWRPMRVFWGIAAVGLLLSFLPIALAGVTGSSAGALGLMHVVAAVTNVSLLTTLSRRG
jgi:Family of unknown function (DUF6069)